MKNKLLFTAILFAIATNTFSQVPNYVPTNGLVGWWPFNGNAVDESINTNDGIVNGATLTTDRFGGANSAYSFDGVNDWIQVANNIALNFSINQQYSLSFWFFIGNGTTSTGDAICKWDSSFDPYPFKVAFESGNINASGPRMIFQRYGGGTIQDQTTVQSTSWDTISYNQFNHVTLTFSPSTGISYFLNGSFIENSNINNISTISNDYPLYFGRRGNSEFRFFAGKLDDIGIWNRALTQCEIQDLYAAQLNSVPVNAGTDLAICAGNAVTLSGNGANTYVWSNSITNGVSFNPTVSNEYVLTGTDINGCLGSDTVNVTVNPLPTVNAGIDQTVCAGTSVTLSGSGANTYSWNNSVSNGVGFTPASTITYTVTGTNTLTGCTNTDQAVVNVNALPTVNAGIDQTVCAGTSVTLSGSGANTYSWNNSVSNGVGFNPTVSNEYVVTGADVNGCLGADTVSVTVNNPSTSSLTETALDSYTLNNQTYTQSGTYTQVIPNAAGCDSTITLNLTLNFTGITELKDGIRIYPNPTFDNLTIERTSSLNSNYILVDSQGRLVLQGELTETITHLSLGKLEYGNYILQLENQSVPIRIVKQ